MTAIAPQPVARSRGRPVGFALGVIVVVLAAWSTLHEQSADLTWDEVAFGGMLAALASGGWLALLVTKAPIGRPLHWAVGVAAWDLMNILVATSNGVGATDWLRASFPQLIFPSFLVLGWLSAPTAEARRRLLTLLTILGAGVILASLLAVRSVRLEEVVDVQFLRRFGGDFYAPFTATLAVVTLFTLDGRRAQPRLLTIALLLVGLGGLAASFTRTYWLSTTFALTVFAWLLLRHRGREFGRLALALPAAAFVVVTAAAILVPGNVLDLLGQRLGDLGDVGGVFSLRERLVESQGALAAQLQNPLSFLAGNGLGARFSYEYVHPVSGIVYGGPDLSYIHNYYVYLLFTKGAVGLFLFVALWASLLRAMLATLRARAPGMDHVPLAGLAATANLLLASLATPQFENFQWPMIYGLLLALAARPLTDRRQESTGPTPGPRATPR